MTDEASRVAGGPLSRPYPHEAVISARAWLLGQGHTRNTVKCAEGFNTPLWQSAVRRHIQEQER